MHISTENNKTIPSFYIKGTIGRSIIIDWGDTTQDTIFFTGMLQPIFKTYIDSSQDLTISMAGQIGTIEQIVYSSHQINDIDLTIFTNCKNVYINNNLMEQQTLHAIIDQAKVLKKLEVLHIQNQKQLTVPFKTLPDFTRVDAFIQEFPNVELIVDNPPTHTMELNVTEPVLFRFSLLGLNNKDIYISSDDYNWLTYTLDKTIPVEINMEFSSQGEYKIYFSGNLNDIQGITIISGAQILSSFNDYKLAECKFVDMQNVLRLTEFVFENMNYLESFNISDNNLSLQDLDAILLALSDVFYHYSLNYVNLTSARGISPSQEVINLFTNNRPGVTLIYSGS